MSINKPLIVIVGPTASGKTKLSIKIAKRFSGEIICADSMTVYREMDIGTAKPTNKERKAIPHHLLDIKNPKEDFSLYEFQKLAQKAITKIQSEGKLPLIVGGTGLFIDSVVYDYKLINVPPNLTLRKKLEKLESKELLERINKIDPELIATSDIKNKRRLIRALEIASSGQNNISKQKRKKKIPKNILYLAIDIPRKNLYEKINQRVEQMFKTGLIKEFKKLIQKYPSSTNVFQNATYKPLVSFWKKEISLDKAKEKIKQLHRNYAKRQLTWFKRNKDIKWLSFDSAQDLQKEAEKLIKEFLKN